MLLPSATVFTFDNITLNLLVAIIVAVVVRYIPLRIDVKWLTEGTAVKRYLRQLSVLVRQLPFIYKDLDGDVLSDFVEVDVRPIDNAESPSLQMGHNSISREAILRSYKQLFVLGNAGVGKTTFMRYVILQILDKSKPDFLHKGERPVPIYIPLKAVQNTAPNPIMRYIEESCQIPISKVRELAVEKRLFLFLDGYDEISTGNEALGEKNFLREELDQIFPASRLRAQHAGAQTDIYPDLDGNRIWFSSRREFYNLNPLKVTGSAGRTKMAASLLRMVEIAGISKHRAELAAKIFDKYRSKSAKYRGLLDEELLLQSIDELRDEEMTMLSMNPLFLTVICYLYANKVLEASERDVQAPDFHIDWRATSYDLILSCVDLLLRDLDKDKARNLQWAPKKALLARRNHYYEEKLAFLKFFALYLFISGQTIFRKSDLTGLLNHYLAHISTSPRKGAIIDDLKNPRHSIPDIATQLIYDGIFTVTDRREGEFHYDFPHRRFKEILACEELRSPASFGEFMKVAHKSSLSELVRMVRARQDQNDPYFYSQVLQRLMDAMPKNAGMPQSTEHTLALKNFCNFAPQCAGLGELVQRFLDEVQSNRWSPSARIPGELLKFINPSTSWLEHCSHKLRDAWDNGKVMSVGIALSIAFHFDAQKTRSFLQTILESEPASLTNARLVAEEWLMNCQAEDGDVFSKMKQPLWILAFSQVLARRDFRASAILVFGSELPANLTSICLFRADMLCAGDSPDLMDINLLSLFRPGRPTLPEMIAPRLAMVIKMVDNLSQDAGSGGNSPSRLYFAPVEDLSTLITTVQNVEHVCVSTVDRDMLSHEFSKAKVKFAKFKINRDLLVATLKEIGNMSFPDEEAYRDAVMNRFAKDLNDHLQSMRFNIALPSGQEGDYIHRDEFVSQIKLLLKPDYFEFDPIAQLQPHRLLMSERKLELEATLPRFIE